MLKKGPSNINLSSEDQNLIYKHINISNTHTTLLNHNLSFSSSDMDPFFNPYYTPSDINSNILISKQKPPDEHKYNNSNNNNNDNHININNFNSNQNIQINQSQQSQNLNLNKFDANSPTNSKPYDPQHNNPLLYHQSPSNSKSNLTKITITICSIHVRWQNYIEGIILKSKPYKHDPNSKPFYY